jgi:hypothetical protein
MEEIVSVRMEVDVPRRTGGASFNTVSNDAEYVRERMRRRRGGREN